jgi:carboxylate-amine ligase
MSGFAFGAGFTVGIEEELLLVDPDTHDLAPVAEAVLAAMDVEAAAAGHDAYAAQLELRSPPSTTVGAAAEALAELRRTAAERGATLVGSGLHPTAPHGSAELVDGSRYAVVADEVRGLLRRTPESALHVHVGLPDEEVAVRAFNALRRQVPLLVGLAANSPFWFGTDSGLASARFALARAYPGKGIPRALRDVSDLEELADATLTAAGLGDATFLWWDLRLHPRYGTIELREMDSQATLEHAAALAALVRALVVEAAEVDADGPDPPSEALAWSAFRAARDGVAATVVDGDTPCPLAHVARDTVARLRPIARSLGDAEALEAVGAILGAAGAVRQREAFSAGGMAGVLRDLVQETRASAERFRVRPAGTPRANDVVDRKEGEMPDKRPSVKNEKQYEALKEKGMSKERAAKIANSPGASSRGGKKSGSGGDSRQGGTTAQKKAAGRKGGRATARKRS